MINFIDPVTTFKDDIFPVPAIDGEYTNTFLKSADVSIDMVLSPTQPLDARLRFIGKFSVSRNSTFKPPYVIVRLIQEIFSIIDDYIKEKPIKDKEGNLFFMPPFLYSEDHFKDVVFRI